MALRNQIRQIRVDIPLQRSCVYLFVDPPRANWHPWWARLYAYLRDIQVDDLTWTLDLVQHVLVARPALTLPQREDIRRFLQTAPRSEVDSHRTLRLAVALDPGRGARLGLVYFRASDEPLTGGNGGSG